GEKNFKNPCIVLLDVYSKFVSPYDGFGDWATPRQPAARLFISPPNTLSPPYSPFVLLNAKTKVLAKDKPHKKTTELCIAIGTSGGLYERPSGPLFPCLPDPAGHLIEYATRQSQARQET